MSHPFQIDKTYRNRVGQYVVLDIDGDNMTIRYIGGATVRTKVSLQARIWENIQFEEQMSREEERRQLAHEARKVARKRSARAKKAKSMPRFEGFEEDDFEPKQRGIAWSSREELGRKLAYEMSHRTEGDFGYWIVPRKSEVHVGRKDQYDRDERDRNAAFFVSVNEHGVSFGFRVGNPGGKTGVSWPISSFLSLLEEDGKERRSLRAAMQEQDLSLDVYAMDVHYGQVGHITVETRGFLWEHETAEQETQLRMNWKQLAEYLESVAPKKQSDLLFRKRLSSKEALDAGKDVVSQILDAFIALLPTYDVTVGG